MYGKGILIMCTWLQRKMTYALHTAAIVGIYFFKLTFN
jgi:hypothetical protein